VIPRTHLGIDRRLVGEPVALGPGSASAALTTTAEMAADERGLVHGGFVFGLADYAAMLAVNDPNVVLASSEARFLKPVVVGESLLATAVVKDSDGRKSRVEVEVRRGEERVMTGSFVCFTLDRHVLDREEKR
jgi:acyl-coenzyme A thioesterase PaaI-like protein